MRHSSKKRKERVFKKLASVIGSMSGLATELGVERTTIYKAIEKDSISTDLQNRMLVFAEKHKVAITAQDLLDMMKRDEKFAN